MSLDFEKLDTQLLDVIDKLKELDAYRTIDRVQNTADFDYDLTTNNYYGFCLEDQFDLVDLVEEDHDYELQARLQEFNDQEFDYGGSTGSRLISGNYDYVRNLEKRFGQYMSNSSGQDVECLLFNSGYHANIGIIPALVKLNDSTIILMDQLIHASFIDGVKLSGATFRRFKHNDLASIEKLLAVAVEKYENVIIGIESIYSMDGDGLETLSSLSMLKAKYSDKANIILYCDEAHAVGLFGKYRFGRCEEENVLNQFDFVVCPLGKAIHAYGCLVFCNSLLKKYLVNTCRSFIYSTALPPVIIEDIDLSFLACSTTKLRKAADYLLDSSENLRQNIRNAIVSRFSNLTSEQVDEILLGDYQITGLILGSNEAVLDARDYFDDKRLKVSAIRYPTVPRGKERIRISLHAALRPEDFYAISGIFEEFITTDLFKNAIEDYFASKSETTL